MILPDYMIAEWAKNGGITPYDEAMVNPASIDLRWSGRYRIAKVTGWSDVMEADVLKLQKGIFYLLDSLEYITMPDDCAGILALKSSMGRQGLEHLHAGYADPKFMGTLTMEIENRAPWELAIKRNQPILQLILERMEAVPYKGYDKTGRYNGQNTPQVAKN